MDSYKLQTEVSPELRKHVILEGEKNNLIIEYRKAKSLLIKRMLQMLVSMTAMIILSILVLKAGVLGVIFVCLTVFADNFILPRYKKPSLLMLWRDTQGIKKQIQSWSKIVEDSSKAKGKISFKQSRAQQVIRARRLDSVPFIVVFTNQVECCALGAAQFQRYASSCMATTM